MATVVFPAWFKTVENEQTGVAIIDFASPNGGADAVGRTSVIAAAQKGNPIAEVPAISNSNDMAKIGGGFIPFELWQKHHAVILIGTEYPEQLEAFVPAGKKAIVVGGPRWLELDDATKSKFISEHSDDVLFAQVEEGGTLEFYADRITPTNEKHEVALYAIPPLKNSENKDIQGQYFDASGKPVPYELGGNNEVVIQGQGDIKGEFGNYGGTAWVTAKSTDIKMGKTGTNFYIASGESAGHKVTGGRGKDVVEFDFTNGAKKIGTNKFDAQLGNTENSTGIDSVQLRKLPVNSKVEVNVKAIRGAGTFPDSDVNITIKNPAGEVLGTIETTNLNYLHIIQPNGTTVGVSPKSIGAGGNRTVTVGNSAAAAARSSLAESEEQPQPESPTKPILVKATDLPKLNGSELNK